jgi:hypothetical protein
VLTGELDFGGILDETDVMNELEVVWLIMIELEAGTEIVCDAVGQARS